MRSMFAGRKLCIATMHGKERVIAPHVEQQLGVRCFVPKSGFDSDQFGTFSGEIPRAGTPLEAARQKASAAMDATGVDLAIASEGSFVPHPQVGLIPVGVELVVLFDRRHDLEILGDDVTSETNHARRECRDLDDVVAFASRIGFPEHGLLLAVGDPPIRVVKGLRDQDVLQAAAQEMLAAANEQGQDLHALSDMRAHQNPTRMRSIDRAASILAKRVATPCPGCGSPGFGKIDVVRGLPCSLCDLPSSWVRAFVHGCSRCDARLEVPRSDGLASVDPGSCEHCNP
jgi:hypothetical protein